MSRRLADGIGLAAACLIGILALQANSGFFHDDGYIGLRYVRHWLAGHGLRWNIGWPPVEGYSNFLYLAAIAPLGHVGIDLAWAARLVNGAAWLGTAALLGRLGAWPAAGVLASLPLTVWTLGGLETPFYAFWVCAGTMASLRAWHRGTLWSWAIAALPLALACMARPDGAVFVAGATAFLGYGLSRDQIQPRCLLAFGGVLALVLLPYAAWKLAYYGDIFPNTFYAKAGGFDAERVWRGLRYVGSYLIRPPYLYLLAGVATVYAWRRRALNAPLVFVGATIGIYLTYVAAVGGDHMPAYRFVAPILPLCFLFIYLALRPYLDALDDKKRLLYWGGFIAVSALQLWTFGGERRPADPAAFCGETVGRHIQAHWPADALVALNTAGSIPYFAADQRFIDMLGLNDAHIAHRHPIPQRTPWQQVSGHAKGDGAYVLDRQPDYIILGPAQGVDADAPYFLSDIEISEDPRFARHYRREQVTLDVSQRQDHHFYLATRSGTLTFTYFRRR